MTRRRAAFTAVCAFALSFGPPRLAAGDASTQSVSTTVDRVSNQVVTYLERLADVKCTETVLQEKLTPSGKVEQRERSTYDYLIMMSGSSEELSLSESRLAEGAASHGRRAPLLVTNGFSTLFLIFHPYYRSSFRFTEEGEVAGGNMRLARIRFEHLPGHRSPIALALRGREYPLDIFGTVYVEPTTGAIVRIESSLTSALDDLGLKSLSSTVTYSPVRLPGAEQVSRFPTEATVDVETRKQHWRNTHQFSKYEEFAVSTEVKVSDEIGSDAKK